MDISPFWVADETLGTLLYTPQTSPMNRKASGVPILEAENPEQYAIWIHEVFCNFVRQLKNCIKNGDFFFSGRNKNFLQWVYMFLFFPYDMLNVDIMESHRCPQLWQMYVKVPSTEAGMKKVLNKCYFHFSSSFHTLGLIAFPLPCSFTIKATPYPFLSKLLWVNTV